MKIQNSRDLILAYMEELRPSTSTPRRFSPVYGFCSSGGLDHAVDVGKLLLLLGKDPRCLIINYLASESCLWERPSLYVSQRERPETVVVELLSSISGASLEELAAHHVDPHAYASVHAAALDMLFAPLYFSAVNDVPSLEGIVMKAKKRFGVLNVFVDDMSLLRLDPRRQPAESDLPHVCKKLQALARRAEVAIFGGLTSMDLRNASSMADTAMRLENLGCGMARLGIQRRGETKPRFSLASICPNCGRIERLRRTPWTEVSNRFEKMQRD